MGHAMCVSKSAMSRKSLNRRMRLSGFHPHVCADLICGRIAAFSLSSSQHRWGTNIAESSRR